MRQTRRFTLIATCAVAALTIGWASAAYAYTTKSAACATCHGTSAAVTVEAAQTANDGVNATYRVTVSNPYGVAGWAVIADGVNIVRDRSATGTFRVAVGGTYTVWGVSNGAAGEGAASVQISPVAPPASASCASCTARDRLHRQRLRHLRSSRLHRPSSRLHRPHHLRLPAPRTRRLRRLRPTRPRPRQHRHAQDPHRAPRQEPPLHDDPRERGHRQDHHRQGQAQRDRAQEGGVRDLRCSRSRSATRRTRKNVVIEKRKTKVTIKLAKPSKHHKNSHGRDRGKGGNKK